MKNNIYKMVLSIFVFITFFGLSACQSNHKEGDGHDHAIETETKTESHEEDNVAVLSDEQMKAVGVEIGKIEQKALSATLKANGLLRVPNSNKANATSLFGGVIKSLHVEIGDMVRKGQVIASISNPQFIQLQEEYLSINSRIEFAEQEEARQRELIDGNVGAKKNLQSATTELHTLKTRKSSLSRQIQMMGINPVSLSNSNLKSSLVVTSPISGTVSHVFAQIGTYVDVSSPIAQIVDNAALLLDLQVYEKDIPSIKIGQKIDFIVTNNPNKTYTAEVFNIGASFSGESKTIAVQSKIKGDKTGLIDGMSITGMLNLDNVQTAAIPDEAIVSEDGKYYMFLVKEESEGSHEHEKGEEHSHNHDHGSMKSSKFIRIEIAKGASQLGYTAITPVSEITPGTHIVIKGAFFVNAKMNDTGEHGHAH